MLIVGLLPLKRKSYNADEQCQMPSLRVEAHSRERSTNAPAATYNQAVAAPNLQTSQTVTQYLDPWSNNDVDEVLRRYRARREEINAPQIVTVAQLWLFTDSSRRVCGHLNCIQLNRCYHRHTSHELPRR